MTVHALPGMKVAVDLDSLLVNTLVVQATSEKCCGFSRAEPPVPRHGGYEIRSGTGAEETAHHDDGKDDWHRGCSEFWFSRQLSAG